LFIFSQFLHLFLYHRNLWAWCSSQTSISASLQLIKASILIQSPVDIIPQDNLITVIRG